MPELIIESVPSGAEVQIDGEVLGITPLTILTTGSLEAFRAECLSSGEVSCDWATLKLRLEDQTVSQLWWDLTYDERRSIALKSTLNVLYFVILFGRTGAPDCEGGTEPWYSADCGLNGAVRSSKFGSERSSSRIYWQHPVTLEEHCIIPDVAYNLPCYKGDVKVLSPNNEILWRHFLPALQIGEDVTDINNWFFFQNGETDIRPGSGQFPAPSTITIRTRNQTVVAEVSVNANIGEFRATCLLNGEVSCSWFILKMRLEYLTVRQLWWDLTEQERRSIAEVAIQNTVFYAIQFWRHGKPNCEGGEGVWYKPECVTNSIVRYQKFAIGLSGVDSCYRTQSIHNIVEECFSPSDAYGLPCHIVSCHGVKDPHSMCSIQVVPGTDSLDNWIVFQYNDFDIKLGDPQMPSGSTVDIRIPSSFVPCSGIVWASTVATFVAPIDELKIFREECLSGGNVTCSWDVLKAKLEDQTVSRLWWDLTRDERRSVAVKATKNTLYFVIHNWRLGKPNCEGGEGDWRLASCGHNGTVRIWKFGTESPEGYHAYWQDPNTKIEHCYVPDIAYNLPCYSAGVGQPNWGHQLATIQIGEDVTDINNWVFFQYNEYDIRPGESWQFPTPSSLTISPIGKPPIVEMDLPGDELAVFRAECLSNGNVSCSWETLKTRLEDQTASRLWWDLTRDERWSIADTAVRRWTETLKNINFAVLRVRDGEENCVGGTDVWIVATCWPNAIVRYAVFGKPVQRLTSCYYSDNVDGSNERCYEAETYYLPAGVTAFSTEGPFSHSVAAIQIDKPIDDINSWYFFQYNGYDIKVGDNALPIHDYEKTHIQIYTPTGGNVTCRGHALGDGYEMVAKWDFVNGELV